MKLGDGVEAAIHCAALLAGLEDDATIPGFVLAEEFGLSSSYLLKHLKALTAASILQSVPGPSGGCRISSPDFKRMAIRARSRPANHSSHGAGARKNRQRPHGNHERKAVMKPRLDYYSKAPELMKAQLALNKAVEESGIERSLLHLVKLRASQINGCSYCVDMHAHEARADGETEQRLYLVAAWKESPLFTERERAALAWTEAVTRISQDGVPDELYAQARKQFSEEDLVKLTMAVAVINTWNRLSVAFHAIHPVRKASAA